MVSRWSLGTVCLLAITTQVLANGRPPQTSSITFRPGAENEILAGTSFGLLTTKDNGGVWRWMCEDALPYGGMYDPDYEMFASGTYFATTFDGLKVNRDGCTFTDTVLDPPGDNIKFFSVIARGPDNVFYAASTSETDSTIFKSTDEGMAFDPLGTAGMPGDVWVSLEVAPTNAQRLYLAGFRFVLLPAGGTKKEFMLFTSSNGGTSWDPLPITDFTLMPNSTLEVVEVSNTDPLHAYARVKLEDNAIMTGVYETKNGGTSWTKLTSKAGPVAILERANGDLVIGTQLAGSSVRRSGQTTFTDLTGAPHINCLAENAAGEVWACTQNFGTPQIGMDGFGIMKTTDLATWTGVLKYQDIFEPLMCPTDTLQYTKCDHPPGGVGPWCGLCEFFGCDPKRSCMAEADGTPPPPKKDGCCETGDGSAPGALAVGAMVGIVLLRRRKRSR